MYILHMCQSNYKLLVLSYTCMIENKSIHMRENSTIIDFVDINRSFHIVSFFLDYALKQTKRTHGICLVLSALHLHFLFGHFICFYLSVICEYFSRRNGRLVQIQNFSLQSWF